MACRPVVIVCLVLVAVAVSLSLTVGADAPPAAEQKTGIPQDPVKQQKVRKQRLDWYRDNTVGAYDRVGNKSQKWDDPARKALEAVALYWAEFNSPIAKDQVRTVAEECDRALAAGCDDPLVCYVAESHPFRYMAERFSPEHAKRLVDRAEALAKSKYPPIRRADALTEAIRTVAGKLPDRAPDVTKWLQEIVTMVPSVLGNGHPEARAEMNRMFEWILDAAGTMGGLNTKRCFTMFIEPIEKMPNERAVALTIRGRFATRQAWDARGAGFAGTVSEDGQKLFKQHLEEAEETLNRSWKVDPENPLTAVEMLLVARGLGFEREKMEMWFRRAMEADPDCYTACAQKLEYLLPRWHGSKEEALEFGRQCAATNNWIGGLPMILVRAHEQLLLQPLGRFRDSSVWDDMNAVFKPLLDKHPNAVYGRYRYFVMAHRCGKPDEAKRLFQPIADKPWKPELVSEEAYKTTKSLNKPTPKKDDN